MVEMMTVQVVPGTTLHLPGRAHGFAGGSIISLPADHAQELLADNLVCLPAVADETLAASK